VNSNKSYITLHKQHVYQLYMLLHYITFENAPSNYKNYLTSEWGKFKLAKQQLSSIYPEVLLFHSKD